MKSIKIIVSLALIGLLTLLSMFFGMPVFSYGFIGIPLIILISGIILIWLDYLDDNPGIMQSLGIIILVVGIIFTIILPIFSSSLFRASDYQELIGDVEERTFSTDISPTNVNDIIVIDYQVAEKVADKKLVDDNLSLGSQVEIGRFTLQKVREKFYYVAPLNHTSWLKWRKNISGTPGYMIVNANNDKDVRLVTEVDGVDIKLKYQDGGCFGSYLPRHLYNNGYRTVGMTDYSFEIDDDFMPWYVVTKYEKTIGYSGNNAIGIILVNPKSGEITEYSIEDAPKWIDRIQPKDFVLTQFNDWGKLVHGIWNFSDKDKRQLSDGVQLVYGEDGNCYLYSGVTSVGRDNASMGFILSDSRTKKTIFYKSSGAIESAIQRSAEQKVSEKGYIASYPRPYNINGEWTYVMALKDTQGLIKKIGLVSYTNYQVVGIGDNIFDALRNYKSALNSTGNNIVVDSDNSFSIVTGSIIRINSIYNNNTNYFYFLIEGQTDKLYVTTSNISNEVFVTEVGDIVELKVLNDSESEIFVDVFNNLNLEFTKSDGQVEMDKSVDEFNESKSKDDIDRRVKSTIETMTDEEKLELLNK